MQDQDSVITVRRLYNGYFGNGKVNISNNGLINNKEYSLVGAQDGSHGVVNVTDKGHWNFNNSKVYAVKMNGQTVSRDGARNLGEVRTGVEAKVNNNLSLWGNVGVQLGDKGYSDTQGMLGVKYSW